MIFLYLRWILLIDFCKLLRIMKVQLLLKLEYKCNKWVAADGHDHGIRWLDCLSLGFKTNFLPDRHEKNYCNYTSLIRHPWDPKRNFWWKKPIQTNNSTRPGVPEIPANSSLSKGVPFVLPDGPGAVEQAEGLAWPGSQRFGWLDGLETLPNLVWLDVTDKFCLEFPKFACFLGRSPL